MLNTTPRRVLLSTLTVAVAGCGMLACSSAEDKLVGTWTNATPSQADFEMRGLTLAADGTYTGYARVRNQEQGFSGDWDLRNDMLVLEEKDRRYEFEIEGDQVVFIDPRTDVAQALDRKSNPR